jgi:hypothetical protein
VITLLSCYTILSAKGDDKLGQANACITVSFQKAWWDLSDPGGCPKRRRVLPQIIEQMLSPAMQIDGNPCCLDPLQNHRFGQGFCHHRLYRLTNHSLDRAGCNIAIVLFGGHNKDAIDALGLLGELLECVPIIRNICHQRKTTFWDKDDGLITKAQLSG